MPPKLKESDYCISWIVMVLCYVVTFSMVGFAFTMVGMSMGWNVRNQGRLLGLISIPVQLLTSYVCFRFLTRELASKAVNRALDERQKQLAEEKKASDALKAADKPAQAVPAQLGGADVV